MKYPVGIQTFENIINDGYVYVDKTDLIYSLVSEGKIYFLSRPRRFGKSLLISTLESYFLGRKELFKGLAIEKLEKEWKEYPVFRMDFNGSNYIGDANAFENKIKGYLTNWEGQYDVKKEPDADFGTRFATILRNVHEQTGLKCVVLIDEYDKPLLDVLGSGRSTEVDGERITLEEKNRNMMKAFYSTLKLADEDLQFVLLTGVTKFAKVSVFSGFNQPDDISLDRKYDTLCGISEDEIDQYFEESVSKMAEDMNVTPSEVKEKLKKQYDGYHFSRRMSEVYNPFSLLCAFKKNEIGDYWFTTGTPTYLINLLDRDNVNLDELVGKYYAAEEFMDFKMDRDAPLPMLYQSGYLTIKGFDAEMNMYQLDIPNNEVRGGFIPLLMNDYFSVNTPMKTPIVEMVRSLKNGDTELFKTLLTGFLSSIPYSMRLKKETERFFQYTFYLILRLISTYLVYVEKQQSQGRVDCVIETDKFIYIFEFKLDGTAEEAMQQINDRGYVREYSSDSRKLFKIGCSFSSETGTIGEWIVKEEFKN